MADLAEIAAEVGIAVVDDVPGDGGDADTISAQDPGGCGGGVSSSTDDVSATVAWNSNLMPEVQELENLFSNRYNPDSDPGYVQNVSSSETASKPPAIKDFFCRRPRDDSRNWNRNRGGRGHYNHHQGGGDRRGRGEYYQNNQSHYGGRGGGGGNYPRDYGDYHQRNDGYRQRNYQRDRSPHR
ncbi:polyribonucleotide nucleotidyltransferase isoform X1 [Aplysia californica]|uniref:Polyribonucleotide nucleotidyltransferase isoform X1 n=1 Tax=Aplysia californica TaxID=6500 RepID=A0ABM0JHH4_APLCA|nr:polyribonucleotide nucleotidyltransferase isoform X1 [Aplysia californica]XP_005093762.1 polyribonucleotide nucleotidyltransferase isoform X1 [Aplysia californica]XP_005093763.1 polyribonucleotide nucleotidyltransferase isoform X1 [Aplysia californica]